MNIKSIKVISFT